MADEKKPGFFKRLFGFGKTAEPTVAPVPAPAPVPEVTAPPIVDEAAERIAREIAEARAAAEVADREAQARAEAEQRALEEAAKKEAAKQEAAKQQAEKREAERKAAEEAKRAADALAAEEKRQRDAAETARKAAEAKAEQERLEQERLEQERLEQERLAKEKAAEERRKSEEQIRLKADADAKAAEEQRQRDAEEKARRAAEDEQRRRAEAEAREQQEKDEQLRREAEEKAARDRAEADRLAAEKAAADRASAEREAADRAAAEKRAADEQAAREQAAREQAALGETARVAAQKAAAEQAAAEKAAAEKIAAEKIAADRAAAEQAAAAAAAVPAPVAPAPKQSWWQKLKSGLSRTANTVSEGITGLFTKRKLDDETLEELEDLLIQADLGIDVAARISGAVGKGRYDKEIEPEEVKAILADEVSKVLVPVAKPLVVDAGKKPFVLLMVGVNGSGKTTTIGKLASKFRAEGKTVMMAAGDTFRAAAIEQLKVWGERTGTPVIARDQGGDASGLAFDAIKAAQEQNVDVLLIDTAGRLQNRTELMAELEKVIRVIKKLDDTAPHATLLVLDATVGQNALSQVDIFGKQAGVTGLVMTKLDGTARGGILVAIAEKFKMPIHFIGVGEGVDDLDPFEAKDFARAIAGLERLT